MSFLQKDGCDFLCLDSTASSGKQYSITAGGQIWDQHDHMMVVLHKGKIKEIAWKDLGNTMILIRLVPNRIAEINNNTDMSAGFINTMYSVLQWYSGYDEETDTSYHYIPKLSGKKLIERLDVLDLFAQWGGTTIIDEKKGRFKLHKKEISNTSQDYILAEFFALVFLFGKAIIQKNVLTSYKLQIPSLHYEIQDKIELIISRMRGYGFVMNMTHNTQQQMIDITTNDYMLLAYLRILLNENSDSILIDKVLEIQQEIFIQYGISPEQKAMRWQLYEIKR